MKNAKINKVVKWCLILAAVVMTGNFCFHSDIIYGEVKGDSIKNITGFMQDPKKNYNTKNKVKIGKVNITSFKNRYTTKAESSRGDLSATDFFRPMKRRDKKRRLSGKKEVRKVTL